MLALILFLFYLHFAEFSRI